MQQFTLDEMSYTRRVTDANIIHHALAVLAG